LHAHNERIQPPWAAARYDWGERDAMHWSRRQPAVGCNVVLYAHSGFFIFFALRKDRVD
jgi:hypothetical protein